MAIRFPQSDGFALSTFDKRVLGISRYLKPEYAEFVALLPSKNRGSWKNGSPSGHPKRLFGRHPPDASRLGRGCGCSVPAPQLITQNRENGGAQGTLNKAGNVYCFVRDVLKGTCPFSVWPVHGGGEDSGGQSCLVSPPWLLRRPLHCFCTLGANVDAARRANAALTSIR